MALAWQMHLGRLDPMLRDRAILVGTRSANVNVRDLFEAFLPAGQRANRLGTRFDPMEVLGLTGNVERGYRLYWHTGVLQCQTCHAIGGRGGQIGPDLSHIRKKYEAAALLESIAEPSKVLEPQYQCVTVIGSDGRTLEGIVVSQSLQQLVLRTADGQDHMFPTEGLELIKSDRSLMADQLLCDLTAQEAADLLAYLLSLQ